MAALPHPLLLLAIGAIAAATAISIAVAKPLIEETMERMGIEPTIEI